MVLLVAVLSVVRVLWIELVPALCFRGGPTLTIVLNRESLSLRITLTYPVLTCDAVMVTCPFRVINLLSSLGILLNMGHLLGFSLLKKVWHLLVIISDLLWEKLQKLRKSPYRGGLTTWCRLFTRVLENLCVVNAPCAESTIVWFALVIALLKLNSIIGCSHTLNVLTGTFSF